MLNKHFILRSFALFFNHNPIKLLIVFFITIVQSLFQGISLVLLIPLLTFIEPQSADKIDNKWVSLLNSTMHHLGISLNMVNILIFFALILIFVAILNYYQSVTQSTYQQSFSYEVRQNLFRKIINCQWQFINSRSKHSHIQILTTEIPKMSTYYYFYLSLAIKSLFIIAHLVIALTISIQFTAFVVMLGLFTIFILRGYLNQAKKLGSANIIAFRSMLKRIDDFWTTVKMAKVHQSEAFYINKFDESNQQMLIFQKKQIYNKAASNLWFMFSGILSLICVVYFAYNYVQLPFTMLLIIILLFSRIFPQFISINNDVNMLYANVASVKMVLSLDKDLTTRHINSMLSERSEDIELNKEIAIIDLCFGYKEPLFINFNTKIPAYKLTGILGASGTGKTTFIDLLTGLQSPDKGEIKIDGRTLTESRQVSWREGIGYLPQDSFFIDGTIRENLVWDSTHNLDDDEIMAVLKQVNAYDLVMKQNEGLDTFIANYQFYFSGGERQRMALARAILRKPKLLLLDEATSSLDAENERIIIACLLKLKNEITIVFVTHHHYLVEHFDYTIDLDKQQ